MTIVTLLTDFGVSDSYVAEVKGALLTRAPDAAIVDLSHEVPAGDLKAGQYLLSRAWSHFPRGTVHLAVVDPGVGTERRALVAASAGHRFLAPDNGLLSFLPPDAVFVALPIPPHASPTFHGRDLFAPAAAAVVLGEPIESLGTPVTEPVRVPLPVPRRVGAGVIGEVLYVDRFGTLVSNISSSGLGTSARVVVSGSDVGPVRRTFADVARGALVAFTGSGGTVEVAVRDGSAAERLAVGVGARVTVGEATVKDGK